MHTTVYLVCMACATLVCRCVQLVLELVSARGRKDGPGLTAAQRRGLEASLVGAPQGQFELLMLMVDAAADGQGAQPTARTDVDRAQL